MFKFNKKSPKDKFEERRVEEINSILEKENLPEWIENVTELCADFTSYLIKWRKEIEDKWFEEIKNIQQINLLKNEKLYENINAYEKSIELNSTLIEYLEMASAHLHSSNTLQRRDKIGELIEVIKEAHNILFRSGRLATLKALAENNPLCLKCPPGPISSAFMYSKLRNYCLEEINKLDIKILEIKSNRLKICYSKKKPSIKENLITQYAKEREQLETIKIKLKKKLFYIEKLYELF